MIDIIRYNNSVYPAFQAEGHASEFAIPYASKFCKGFGYDVGCMKKEWAYPGAVAVDLSFDDGFHALNLPNPDPDYIFSSHCLEHTDNWIEVLDYWYERLKLGGVLFLYLPDYSQEYWRPWNNRKHTHAFSSTMIYDYMKHKNYKNIFVSGVDLNNSFMIVGEK